MKKQILFTATLALALCAGCDSNDEPGFLGEKIILTPEEKELTEGLTEFQNEFFKSACSLSKPDQNVVVSPFSAQVLISMVANATGKEVHEEILDAMDCDNLTQLNNFNAKLLNGLSKADSKVKVAAPNSVWYHNTYDLNQTFSSNLGNSYLAETFKRDFDNQSTVSDINEWCSKKTSGLIPEFISSLSSENTIILLNALFFNGEWRVLFDKKNTYKQPFYGSVTTNDVDMMHVTTEDMLFREFDHSVAARKDFGRNNAFSVWFVLPDKRSNIDDVISSFDVSELTERYFTASVDLSLPRFAISTDKMDLKNTLKNIGINAVFEPGDFSPFNETFTKYWEVSQKICVEFNEEGAKVAVITCGKDECLAPPPTPHKVVVLDRPFLFYIMENESNSILAAGRIMNL